MHTLEKTYENNSLAVEWVAQKSYQDLLGYAEKKAEEVNLGEYTDTTFELLEHLRTHDEDVALGGLRTLPIALDIAEQAEQVTGRPIDKRWQFAVALLHDIGKITLPTKLLQKSAKGEAWTEQDMAETRPHAQRGGQIMKFRGYPEVVYKAVAGHHSKQIGSKEYGLDIAVTDEARTYRDSTAIADYIEASENRNNSRNRSLTLQQRRKVEAEDIIYVFHDYKQRDELASCVIAHSLGMYNFTAQKVA